MRITVTGCKGCPFVIVRHGPEGHCCGAPHEYVDWKDGEPEESHPAECPLRGETIEIVAGRK